MSPRLPRIQVLAAALVALAMTAACGDAFQPPAAVVEGTRITNDELSQNVPLFRFLSSLGQVPCGDKQPGESQNAACARFALGQLIEQELVTGYAREHHVGVTPTQILNAVIPIEQQLGGQAALRQQLAAQGLTFADFRHFARRVLIVRKVARILANHTLTDAQLFREYQRERVRFTLIHTAHILLRSRRAAETIAAQATPQNFADLARRYSQDPSASAGGDLGTTPASQLDPTFANAALQLSPGEISPPVHTRFGWHVIELISEQMIPFQRARARLVSDLSSGVFVRWLKQRVRTAGIDVNPRFGHFNPGSGQVLTITCTADSPDDCQS